MGTRHLTAVKFGGSTFGQYGQWDGYPDGAGKTVMEFVESTLELEEFIEHFEHRVLLNGDQKKIDEINADKNWAEKYPQLSRDMGADILEFIQKTKAPLLHDQWDFAAESLFCEWVWLLDLDRQSVRCFMGFNKSPLPEGSFFKTLDDKIDKKTTASGETYYPCREFFEIKFADVKKKGSAAVLTEIEDLLAKEKPEEDAA